MTLVVSLLLAASPIGRLCLVVDQDHQPVLTCAAPKGTAVALADVRTGTISSAEVGVPIACPDLPDLNPDYPTPVCSVLRVSKGNVPMAPAVAVLPPAKVTKVGQALQVDFGSGKPVTLRVCNALEGMHFTAWEGEPLRGNRVWRVYFYTGRKVETTCNPGEVPVE